MISLSAPIEGRLFLIQHGYHPHISMGDFDSVTTEELALIRASSIAFIDCDPIYKDLTDTEMAFNWALDQQPEPDPTGRRVRYAVRPLAGQCAFAPQRHGARDSLCDYGCQQSHHGDRSIHTRAKRGRIHIFHCSRLAWRSPESHCMASNIRFIKRHLKSGCRLGSAMFSLNQKVSSSCRQAYCL